MPAIIIKDYTWRQTAEALILHVPLSGHPKTVDLFATDNYVKVSFPPFILELFLWSNVIEEESKCTLTDSEAIFLLRKAQIGTDWPSLVLPDINNEIKRQIRNSAFEHARQMSEDRAKAKSEKRQFLQKQAVREQIDLDTATLNRIQTMRDDHRKESMQELENWKAKSELPILQQVEGDPQENRKAYRPPLKWFNDPVDGSVKSRELTREEIFDGNAFGRENQSNDLEKIEFKNEESTNDPVNEEKRSEDNEEKAIAIETPESEENSVADSGRKNEIFYDILEKCSSSSENFTSDDDADSLKKSERTECMRKKATKDEMEKDNIFEDPAKSIPLPRKNCTINVTFSERAFPTPARESSYLGEQEWLQKQAEARRKTGFVAEDLRPEERDPQWLKDKGDDFFQVGNYLAAISAYSLGIKISDKMASLYVNRSAAHYALGNYCRCVEDSSKALELMEPKCQSNLESRARCHARRGAALCKLSAPQHGIPELETALELAPDNESIKRDVLAAKQYFDIKD